MEVQVEYFSERKKGNMKYYKVNRNQFGIIAELEIEKWEYDRAKKTNNTGLERKTHC